MTATNDDTYLLQRYIAKNAKTMPQNATKCHKMPQNATLFVPGHILFLSKTCQEEEEEEERQQHSLF